MIGRNVFSYKTFVLSFLIHLILIFALLLSPVARGRGKYKSITYNVSLSYLPVKKTETKTIEGTKEIISKEKKEGEIKTETVKKVQEKKKEGMKPLKSEKEEKIPSSEENNISFQGTKVEGLDAPYFPFNYYLTQVLGFISSNWYKPPSQEGTYCTVYFVISKSGRIIDSKVETSSGNAAFDRAALRAVLASNPLPPLPYDYYEEKLGIHLRFQ